MACFEPRYVSSLEDLHSAVNENAALIIICNDEIIPETKRRVERDSSKRDKRNKNIGMGIGLLIAGGIATSIFPITSTIAAIGTAAGLIGTGKIAKNALTSFFYKFTKELRVYKWVEEVSTDKVLVLYRYSHGNIFNPDIDTIVISGQEVKLV